MKFEITTQGCIQAAKWIGQPFFFALFGYLIYVADRVDNKNFADAAFKVGTTTGYAACMKQTLPKSKTERTGYIPPNGVIEGIALEYLIVGHRD